MVVVALRTPVNVAGAFMLGRGVLFIRAGSKRERSRVSQVFAVLTRQIFRLARLLLPRRIVPDRHLWIVGTLLLAWMWMILFVAKVYL